MNVREWSRIIETINNYMPYIESDIDKINGYYLVRGVSWDYIPKSWSGDFY